MKQSQKCGAPGKEDTSPLFPLLSVLLWVLIQGSLWPRLQPVWHLPLQGPLSYSMAWQLPKSI